MSPVFLSLLLSILTILSCTTSLLYILPMFKLVITFSCLLANVHGCCLFITAYILLIIWLCGLIGLSSLTKLFAIYYFALVLNVGSARHFKDERALAIYASTFMRAA